LIEFIQTFLSELLEMTKNICIFIFV